MSATPDPLAELGGWGPGRGREGRGRERKGGRGEEGKRGEEGDREGKERG